MPRSMSSCVVVSRVALHEVGLARRRALERALAEQVVHERADVEPDLRPQRLVVGLEHHPLRAAVEALLDEQREAPHRQVLPLATPARRRRRSVRAPQTTWPDAGNVRRQLTPSGLSRPFSASVSVHRASSGTPTSVASRPAGAFQTPRVGVGARDHAGDRAARGEGLAGGSPCSGSAAACAGSRAPRSVRSTTVRSAGAAPVTSAGSSQRRRVDDQHRAARLRSSRRRVPHRQSARRRRVAAAAGCTAG